MSDGKILFLGDPCALGAANPASLKERVAVRRAEMREQLEEASDRSMREFAQKVQAESGRRQPAASSAPARATSSPAPATSGPSVAQSIYEAAPAALKAVLDKTDRRAWRAAVEGYDIAVALTKLDLAELREAAQNGNATALKIVRLRERALADLDFRALWPSEALAMAEKAGFTEQELRGQFDKERAADAAGR